MAISWTSAVALANRIASDVPAVKTMLDALAKMDFTGITSIPANVKRIASVTGGVQLQKYASNAWSSIGKLMHDVDTVDGFHAGTGTTKNTIPVRDANGALPGNITGNAATASKASALADGYTVPLAKGGTGATTAAAARVNLGADNAANITKGTLPTARGGTGRTDGFVTDVVIDASGTKAKDVGQLGRAKSLSRVDANTILKHGRYNVYYATTALNFPLAGDMLLDVIVWGDDNITQIVSPASNAYQYDVARTSFDGGATWGGWLPRSGFLNADIHIYVSKDGDDKNAGYSADKPLRTMNMAVYKMLMMKPGIGKSFYLHFGPGEWGNMTLHTGYTSGSVMVVTSLAAANTTTEPADMPKFGTLTAANGAMVLVRNIEADRVACSYQSRIHAQYYNKIGAVVAGYNGRFFFDSTSFTGIKAQTVQPTAFANLYRHGSLDIINGATFDILENITYSAAFLYAVDYSEINIGSSITAASFKNAARVTGKKFHFVSTEIVDSNTRRTLLPGNTAGTYGNGNLINGMATDITVDGTPSDTAVKRGQIGDAVIVSAVSNLNDYQKSGEWFFNNSAIGTNFPSTAGGFLSVSKSSSYVKQIYRVFNSDQVFERKFNSAWTAWVDRAATAQAAANNALTVANSKAPGGFGLGSLLLSSNLATDLNTTKLTGWYAVNPATLNKPDGVSWGVCEIISGDNNEIHQHLFCSQGIYHRYISITNSVYKAWTKLFDSSFASVKARIAERLRSAQGDDMLFSWQGQTGSPAWLWGGNDGRTMYVWSPANLNVGYANSAAFATSANFARENVSGAIGAVATGKNGDKLPAGGTWRVAIIRRGYGADAGWWTSSPANSLGYAAGGTTVSGGGTNGYDWLAIKSLL